MPCYSTAGGSSSRLDLNAGRCKRLLAVGLAGLLLAAPIQEGWAATKKAPPTAKPGQAARHRPAPKALPRRPPAELGAAEILPDHPGVHGRASFYGHGFQGRRTATGDRFDVRGFTGASNHFPLGSWVAVRRLDSNRCVAVRINDRMGASRRRVIDLSRGGAQELGTIGAGVALVRVVPLAGKPGRPGRLPAELCQGIAEGETDLPCADCEAGGGAGLRLPGVLDSDAGGR